MENRQASQIFAANGDSLMLDVNGLATLGISLRGTFVGTVQFEVTFDGKTWIALNSTPVISGSAVTSATAVGQWQANVAGALAVRARVSAFTSGGPEVVLRAVPAGVSSTTVSGGGGAATIADGADVAEGAVADAVWTSGNGTVIGLLKGLMGKLASVATNVAIAMNPLNIGAQAVSSEPAAITTGRMAQMITDLVGKLIVLPYANPENFVSGAITTAMTATTSTSLIAAPASGLRNYITQITVSNSHATVGTDVVIQDGSGGTTLYTIPAAAVYGGAAITLPVPIRQPTTATAIFCANVTTGASTKVSASGYKGI